MSLFDRTRKGGTDKNGNTKRREWVPLHVEIPPAISNFIEQEARFKGCKKWVAVVELMEELQTLRKERLNLVQSLAIPKRIQ